MLPLSSLCPAVLAWLPKEFVKRPNLNNKLGHSKSTNPDKKVKIPKDIFEKDSKKFNCNQCAKSYFHKSDLLRHMKKDHESFACENCEQSYSKLTDLKKHANQFCHFCMEHIGTQLKRHLKSAHKDIRYPCDKCDKSFDRPDNLQRHIKSDHLNIQYTCEICDKSFTNQGNLKKHIYSDHTNKEYPCEECDKWFKDQGNLQRHIKSDHLNIQYPCDKCDKSFDRQDNLQRHIKSVHENILYNCEKCDQIFKYQGDLQRHLKSEHQDTRYKCYKCDKLFKYQGDFKRHAKSHSTPQIPCSVCGIKFWTKRKLDNHEYTAIHRKNLKKCIKHTCTICGLFFLKRSDFNKHRKYPCPYRCSKCEESFDTKKEQVRHIQEDHKTISCVQCNKVFPNLPALKKHNEVTFHCVICTKIFCNQDALDKHIKTHSHCMSSLDCFACGRTFKLRTNMDKHIKEFHSDQIDKQNSHKIFSCDICTKSFPSLHALEKHKEYHN